MFTYRSVNRQVEWRRCSSVDFSNWRNVGVVDSSQEDEMRTVPCPRGKDHTHEVLDGVDGIAECFEMGDLLLMPPLVFNRLLTDEERERLWRYLITVYGIDWHEKAPGGEPGAGA
jgi:hypothetical protein